MAGSNRTSLDSLDELDPLHEETTSIRHGKDEARVTLLPHSFSRRASVTNSWQNVKRYTPKTPRSWCAVLAVILALSFALLSGGGYWAVKVGGVPPDGQSEPWYPTPRAGTSKEWAESFRKASAMVGQMTLVEKVNVTSGVGWMMGFCMGNTGPVPRLGFPSLCLQDGPLGLRHTDHTSAFPAGLTVGATWNKDLMYERGKAHGKEARGKGIHVILGPAMGPIGRLPAGGRNWEGFGSDPVLQGVAAASTIKGIQDQGVQATAKHYIANEQEHYRQSWEWGTPNAISSNIDDRTLHEIYAWPFADSIKAGVASIMCSYNQVNNSYACGNSKLLNGILKDELGFQGYVQSDWLAQRGGVSTTLAGLDMTMPGDGLIWARGQSLWGAELTKSVLNGTVPVERLDDMVLRIVAAWYYVGQDDRDRWPVGNNSGPNFSSWTKNETGLIYAGSDEATKGIVNKFVDVSGDHHLIAKKVAEEGVVLVKNDDFMLPLLRSGHDMTKSPTRKLKVGFFGEGGFDNPKGPNACEDRACNDYHLGSGWGSGAVEFPYLVPPTHAIKEAFEEGTVEFFSHPSNDLSSKVDSGALHSDICIVFISSDAGEGYIAWKDVKGDRNDLHAQKGGDKLVKRIASKCGNNGKGATIVVLNNVGPVIMEEWIDLPTVKAVLVAHLGGQESGNALASVMFGFHNPSGRLPYTIAKKESDYGPDSGILRRTKSLVPQQNFTERIYIDYRYFDVNDISPRFEFGYGMSYSTFNITGLRAHQLQPEVKLRPASPPTGEPVPALNRRTPVASDALFPTGFHEINKYIYPYISSVEEALPGPDKYPYPDGYSRAHPPSRAGGAPGGNPDLFKPLVLLEAEVANLGPEPGQTVVQVYVGFPNTTIDTLGNAVDFPPRQLRAFEKVSLHREGDESKRTLSFELTRRDLSYWDVGAQNWLVDTKGTYTVWAGWSSRDLPSMVEFKLPAADEGR